MIPDEAVRSWQAAAPIDLSALQACQELMLRRLMIEVGNHPYLGEYTALTGGTTLHHALLPERLRYSEDLDLLMRRPTGHNLSKFYGAWRNDIAPKLGLMTNSHAHTEYPKMRLLWKQPQGEEMMVTIDLARHPENVITGERATKRSISIESEWFSGSADAYCVLPVDLAASKLSACTTRVKPRDLFDLQVMREPLGIQDEEIVERFLENHVPSGWDGETGKRVAEMYGGSRFQEAVEAEIDDGFLPEHFSVAEASEVYASLVELVGEVQESR